MERGEPRLESVAVTIPTIFKGKRIFITGTTGFKGSWLASWLHLLGAEVTGFSLPAERDNNPATALRLNGRIREITGDIRDRRQLSRALAETQPEFVFHLAAQALVLRSYQDPCETFETNVLGALNLLEAIRSSTTVRVLIYVTSDKCYANSGSPAGLRETDPLGGLDPYSASKACAELLFCSYHASFFSDTSGLAAASVRAGNVIGGGDWAQDRIVPDCIRALQCQQEVQLRNPLAIRPWQHVLEPLAGYLMLASILYEESPSDFEGSWNFGPDPDSHRTVRDLVREVYLNWGVKSAGQTETRYRREYEAPALYLNCDKAKQRLGWRPTWTFEEAVQYTTDWYKRYLSGGDVWDLTISQILRFSQSTLRAEEARHAVVTV